MAIGNPGGRRREAEGARGEGLHERVGQRLQPPVPSRVDRLLPEGVRSADRGVRYVSGMFGGLGVGFTTRHTAGMSGRLSVGFTARHTS